MFFSFRLSCHFILNSTKKVGIKYTEKNKCSQNNNNTFIYNHNSGISYTIMMMLFDLFPI